MAAAGDKDQTDMAAAGPGADVTDVDIQALRSKVTNAVRTAITDVVTKSGANPALPEADFDFSMRDETVQALPQPIGEAVPVTPGEASASRAIGKIRPGELDAVSVWRHQLPAALPDAREGGTSGVVSAMPMVAAFVAGVIVAGGIVWQISGTGPVSEDAGRAAAGDGAKVVVEAVPAVPAVVPAAKTAEAASAPPKANDATAIVVVTPQADSAPAAATPPAATPKVAAVTPEIEAIASAPTPSAFVGTSEPAAAAPELLKKTEDLIQAGDVAAARKLLLDHAGSGASAEVALALAKTYDPNVLRAVGTTGTRPDAAEAERWYRRWYELAVRDGMAANPQRLERLVRSLR